MKIYGVKLVPVIIAALAMYGIGFVIYGLLYGAQWMAWNGFTEEMLKGHEWKMGLSWIMPLAIAIAVAKRGKIVGAHGIMGCMKAAVPIAFILVVGGRLYNFVYSNEIWQAFALDAIHLTLISLVGGAVIGALKGTE